MRNNSNSGSPMLVKLPTSGYKNTGEGGMAFFLIVRGRPYTKLQRQTCIAGDIWWGQQDCLLKPQATLDKPQPIDAGLLIGSTGLSLWSDTKGAYFTPNLKDLTPTGKRLYHTLKHLYGEVIIATLLDT